MTGSLAIHGSRIWTGDQARPWAESVVITDGMITAVDDHRAVHDCENTLDASGQTVLPGLIDTHTHLLMGGESLSQLDLSGARSRSDFEARIRDRHQSLPPNQWLRAHGWHDENWGGGMPDKSWLSAAEGRPAVAYRMDSHVCVVNGAVLQLLDLPATDPAGGRIDRDTTGKPTGVFYEAAAWELINPIIPAESLESRQAALLAAQSHAHSFGLTTVGTMEYSSTVREVFEPLRSQLTLRSRITLLDRSLPIGFSFGESFENDATLAIIGYKAFLDGTLGARTARLLEEYADDPGNRGLWVELAADGQLANWYRSVIEHGFQPSMHAIGDAAVRLGLDVIAESRLAIDAAVIRPRIEHAQLVDPPDLPCFKGLIASMQPLHRADDGRYVEKRIGVNRLDRFYTFRSLLGHGAVLAFGSDWPIVSCDPLLGIRAAVTGRTCNGVVMCEDETITVEQALRAYTRGASYALRCEEQIGSIEVGKRGDVVMLDCDPFAVNWATEFPRVLATIVDGVVVAD